jgi:microcystin degradation protein MlrC
MTALMVASADVIVPYRTYPHVDMKVVGRRAVELLRRRVSRGKPFAKAFRQLDYWMPITSQCTMADPMQAVMARRAAIEQETGAAELAWCFGFPYADFADCGAAIAAFAEEPVAADAAADALLADLVAREASFGGDIMSAAEAVAVALAEPEGPVVIADTQDNPGGGGHGDTTGLLAELIRQGAAGTGPGRAPAWPWRSVASPSAPPLRSGRRCWRCAMARLR